MRALRFVAVACVAGCGASNAGWGVDAPEAQRGRATAEAAWKGAEPQAAPAPNEAASAAIEVKDFGGTPRAVVDEPGEDLFRNTYYDFPREGSGDRSATVYDAQCAPIAKVTQAFHDAVCVQGSGRLSSGDTVSFAKRGCVCASVCPRTGQQICFERLDPARFPHGRGAAGRPITPLRSVAVDVAVIPLGTAIYVPEFAGLTRPDGKLHDGCFVAEDRGIKVVGRHIDLFTGDPEVTRTWNQLVPSNRGVHVRLNEARCRSLGVPAVGR